MDNNVCQICPKCGMAINPGDNATACPVCGVAHHLNCWIENQGCAVAACPSKQPVAPVEQPVAPVEQPVAPVEQPVAPVEQPVAPVEPAYQQPVEPAYQQPAYQAPVEQPAYQQPVYPAPAQAPSHVCTNCGTVFTSAFCPKCGYAASTPAANPAVAQYNAQVAPQKKSSTPKIIGIIAAVVVVIVLIVAISGGSGGDVVDNSDSGYRTTTTTTDPGPNFKSLYNQYCSSTWAKVGSDGSYLSIDTNPYDWDDDGLAYEAAWYAIQNVNDAIGLPESLQEDMSSTRGMDGKQTRTYSSYGVEVSWSYHPDKGLEVTYRKIY